jgi:RNA polymerase sigma factor (sigma-70 family)
VVQSTPEEARERLWQAVLAERERAQRVARARCGMAQEAEDCVQEAMLRVVTMPGVDPCRVGTLLTTVVANLAADGHRARARALRAQPRLATAHVAPSPEDAVCDDAEARWLWSRRGALPEQDRAVLELRTQGLTVAETAAALGVSYKASESAFTRARSRMRAIWQATAAMVGVLCGRPAKQSGAGGAVAAAAVSAAVVGSLLPSVPGLADPPPNVARTAPAPQEDRQAAGGTERARAADGRVTTPAPPSRSPAAAPAGTGPTAQPVLLVPVVEAPHGTRSEGTRVEQRRPDESLERTLRRCLAGGLYVSPYHIDCEGGGSHGPGTQYVPPG